MKVYGFGDSNKPSIMLFPGTCCYWKTNFGHVLEGLQQHFYSMIVSYSGFDETENTTFISELDEVEKIEAYIKEHLNGKLFAAYGCSLGGSVVSLLVSRQNIHIDHAMRNQFCTDLYTKVGEQIQVPGTTIHVFYALKMGEKYRKRYLKYFADPDICEYNLQHEELLLDAERWIQEVVRACGKSVR